MIEKIEELYRDAQLYDDQNSDVTEDLEFWAWAARSYGRPGYPILELGSGSGRVSINLAELGYSTIGLDLSPHMIALAKKKIAQGLGSEAGTCEFHRADIRDFRLHTTFPLIIFPYNSLSHLVSNEDLDRCLQGVLQHLEPRGRFVFSVFLPLLGLLTRDPQALYPLGTFRDSQEGVPVELFESMRYDPWNQINHITWYFFREGQDDPVIQHLQLRMFFPQDLEYILRTNGFQVEHRFGDYSRGRIEKDSVVQALVVQRR
ncbi:class I SAM-dependent DNA methyltransferase [Spirochaeta lutea]|uniref:Methyltransferase domain-containing protein n=1 Tax=Spirochaeta lutea TaxID=1480694 RepID=A0A098R4C3_9SPIO|nr:class I SAM-dependent methyltransferase [Spirochaeta lutea]KGE73617.1 hypothetical protein DC28_02960 [Spirochaeta lutea]